jgi:hypothetical protein
MYLLRERRDNRLSVETDAVCLSNALDNLVDVKRGAGASEDFFDQIELRVRTDGCCGRRLLSCSRKVVTEALNGSELRLKRGDECIKHDEFEFALLLLVHGQRITDHVGMSTGPPYRRILQYKKSKLQVPLRGTQDGAQFTGGAPLSLRTAGYHPAAATRRSKPHNDWEFGGEEPELKRKRIGNEFISDPGWTGRRAMRAPGNTHPPDPSLRFHDKLRFVRVLSSSCHPERSEGSGGWVVLSTCIAPPAHPDPSLRAG